MPFLLWQRTSCVYQDHRLSGPNFLRSACPLPGCQLSSFTGSCPMENVPAGYRLLLCISLTDLHASRAGTLRRTFPQPVPHTSQPFLSWLDSTPGTIHRRLSPALTGYCLFLFPLLCRLYLWPSDVGRILRTFKIKKNVEVTDNGKDDF